ncbi:PTS sugar transporter subunit IIB [Aliivibrio sp. S4TY2]|uniref:PTS sugar transporter subunit IIB n=1 Tax=unclassified Aliivibrio TaxID=2645654 RepID=UPI002379AD3C|nr:MULTISPECIES: PTS sugar transporter subunit IIB [unclassified Aliivibrio]MDD9157198.1 PTS sugar transporter subunit IIB [Aliivibrio sp. S4TY2]MDD9160969.1 PTS sugar transporter subunit IIB [Aliivibrio sp. S4TY1]MDD9165110.1 PTS sugar transporter subunit IIB [Aliivibrio sp. S4MY2]MDD9168997.1 PTS sugar transporter subunit IIB [Aliivibrio sp. S4MY4]MDD9185725.1 PTS sugar transporter subunit IIB [Aliivibrio sp. S4MY3]
MKKILLLCAAGMSTSMVVKKMRESAELQGLEIHIEAHGVETIQDYLAEYDLFLLGPQIRFKKDELQKLADEVNKKVEVIDMMDYGMMKGDKILKGALVLLG